MEKSQYEGFRPSEELANIIIKNYGQTGLLNWYKRALIRLPGKKQRAH